MRRQLLVTATAVAMGCGCSSSPRPAGMRPVDGPSVRASSPASGPTVATVDGQAVAMQELQQALIEGYGLNVLLNLVQLKLAQQQAVKAAVIVTPEDIRREKEDTVSRMFRDGNQKLEDELTEALEKKDEQRAAAIREELRKSNQALLTQFLRQQGVSEAEFDIVMEANAHLRKAVEPGLKDKISEENLQQAFKVEYGEKVVVRHIECDNAEEVARARAELAAGAPFDKTAAKLSRNGRTRALGGLLDAFSRQQPGLSQEFIDVAFSLKPGQVSEDTVQAGGAYHIIKCEYFIQPRAVKFEFVKEALRQKLYEKLVQFEMARVRQDLGQVARQTLQIEEPTLRKQYAARAEQATGELKEREAINRELLQQRLDAATRPSLRHPATTATAPATTLDAPSLPANPPLPAVSPLPATGANERPPATRPVAPPVSPATTR